MDMGRLCIVCAYIIILPHMPIFTNVLIGYIVKIESHTEMTRLYKLVTSL